MKHLNTLCRSVAVASCALLSTGGSGAAAETAVVQEQTIDAIRAYLTASWRNAGVHRQDWDDCTQQALLRVLQRLESDELPTAMNESQSHQRRELNRCVWATVQKWRRQMRRRTCHSVADVADPRSERRYGSTDELQDLRDFLRDAPHGLSPRQHCILSASLEGLSVSEISRNMNIPANRVSDEKYKALQKLRQRLTV